MKCASVASLVVGAALLLATAGCSSQKEVSPAPPPPPTSQPGPQANHNRGLISLELRNGICTPITPRFIAHWKAVAQWKISNFCGEDHVVRIANFKKDGKPLDPMGCPAADRAKTVPNDEPGPPDPSVILSCVVKDAPEEGIYTYDVLLDSEPAGDPELEIRK